MEGEVTDVTNTLNTHFTQMADTLRQQIALGGHQPGSGHRGRGRPQRRRGLGAQQRPDLAKASQTFAENLQMADQTIKFTG